MHRRISMIPLVTALALTMPAVGNAQAQTAPATDEAAQPSPPPPPPAGVDVAAPPPAGEAAADLLNHRAETTAQTPSTMPASGPWLRSSGDCSALLDARQWARALVCAAANDHPTVARAREQLADWDEAGARWRKQQATTTGAMSMEVMRRANAVAEIENGITAIVGSKSKQSIRLLKSARQTMKRQAAEKSLQMRYPAAVSLQLGWAWRARRRVRDAKTMFAEAARARSWVRARAQLATQRLRSRTLRKGPWPLVERSYGGPGSDEINAVTALADGDLLLAGRVATAGAQAAQLAVWRTDGSGRQRWRQVFGSEGHDEAHGVTALADGGLLAIGETVDSSGGSDVLLVRVSKRQQVLWHQSSGGPGYDCGVAVIERPNGWLWAATTTQAGSKAADIRLLMVSANGQERLMQRFEGGGEDKASAIISRGRGALLAGSGRGHEGAAWRGRLIALDGKARALWKRSIQHADGCTIEAVCAGRKGKTMVVGRTWVAGGGPRVFLALVDQGGRVRWKNADKRLVDADVGGVVMTGRNHIAVLARGSRAGMGAGAWLLGYRGKRGRWMAPIGPAGVRAVNGLVTSGRYGFVAVGGVNDRGHGHLDGWLSRTGK